MSLETALHRMLAPVVKFAVKRALPIQDFIELVKDLYVKETASQMKAAGFKPNVTQLATATGMHRRDVTRLFEQEPVKKSEEPAGILMKVLGVWENNPQFSEDGKPKVLECKGKGNEFQQLVRSITLDLSPRAVLIELQRLQLVEVEDRKVNLVDQPELLVKTDNEGLYQVGLDLQTVGDLAYENLYERQEPPNLHARTEYDNIYVDSLPEIRQWLVDLGTEVHQRVREYLSKHDKDLNPSPKKAGGGRVSFGTFSHSVDDSSS